MRISFFGLISVVAWLIAGASAAQPLPEADPVEVGLSAERLQRLANALIRDIKQDKLPGAVVVVARRGRVAFFEAFGYLDKNAGSPMLEDGIFRIYSMTKPFTSIAAMILMERGRLQLTDPVSRYLPELTDLQVSVRKEEGSVDGAYHLVPAEREMTIYDLLRHTAGVAYGDITGNPLVKEAYLELGLYAGGNSTAERDQTPAEQIKAFSKAPLIHQPGRVWEYSLATDLLGRVIERIAGMPLGQFLKKNLFDPLNMSDTGFFVPVDEQDRIAEPLPINAASGKPNAFFDVTERPASDSGGAGAVSTASDYLSFAQMLLNGGQLDGKRILSRSSIALMTSDHISDDVTYAFTPGAAVFGASGYTFGLGFGVREASGMTALPGTAGEYLWAGWAGTFFWVEPEEQLVAVFMSQGQGLRQYYRKLIKQLIDQAIID